MSTSAAEDSWRRGFGELEARAKRELGRHHTVGMRQTYFGVPVVETDRMGEIWLAAVLVAERYQDQRTILASTLGESLATAPRRIFLRAKHELGNSSERGEKMKVG